jgi:hypothetical protein
MDLPELLRTTRSALPPPRQPLGAGLGLQMQHQEQTQWCWAAVATSVSLFYNPAGSRRQCELVNAELGQTTCCRDGSSPACNRWWYLDRALRRVGHLRSWAPDPCGVDTVHTEINGQHPVGVRIGWQDGGGHFVVVDGYSGADGRTVSVRDPWYGSSELPYDKFATSYQGSGRWTHTYLTTP